MKLQIKSDYPFTVNLEHNKVDGMMTGTHFPSVKKFEAEMDAIDLTVLDAQAVPQDTLPQWLWEQFGEEGGLWADRSDYTKAGWVMRAAEVRKAVARGGMPGIGDLFTGSGWADLVEKMK